MQPGNIGEILRAIEVVISGGSNGGVFVYSPGAPAAGNLVASIVAASGVDPYGNALIAGITSYDTTFGSYSELNAGTLTLGRALLDQVQLNDRAEALLISGLTNNTIRGQYAILFPSNDTTGAKDAQNMNFLLGTLGISIVLTNGTYYLNANVPIPWNCLVKGSPWLTQINQVGTGDCFTISNPTTASGNFSTQQDQSGGICDLLIDGAGAGAGSKGIHIGNGLGYIIDNVFVRNYTGAGSVGVHFENSIWWTEKGKFRIQVSNCTTCYLWSVSGTGTISFEYSTYDLVAYWGDGQSAFVVNNGAFFGGNPDINWRGNVKGSVNPGPFLTLSGGVLFRASQVMFRPENNGTVAPQTILDNGGGLNHFLDCMGFMDFGGNAWAASNMAAGTVSLGGYIRGDSALQSAKVSVTKPTVTTPAVPAASTDVLNTFGCDVIVYINANGATGIATTINGGNTTPGGGTFYLPANGKINLGAYVGGPPTWAWHAGSTW